MHALGEYLARELEIRNWTQADLARHSGLTRQSISKLMAPDRTQLGGSLSRHTFIGLSHALGVPPEDLVAKAAEAMNLPVPPVELHRSWEAPVQTMAALESFLRADGLSVVALTDYLRLYLQLAGIVTDEVARKAQPNS